MAAAGRALLYQHGVGLGYLATVRRDGAPRLHPVCPILSGDGLYLFLGPSPKTHDLRRDPRYALHAFPNPERDDEFYLSGATKVIVDPDVRSTVQAAYHAPVIDHDVLFELLFDRALLAEYKARGDWPPRYTIWPPSPLS
jgi:hypothetical protein